MGSFLFRTTPPKTATAILVALLLIGPLHAAEPPTETAEKATGSAVTAPAEVEPASAPSQSIPLAPVEVHGKRSLFDEQAAKRKKLLDESAPCLGCDAKPLVHHPKLLERLANSALNQVTPQAAPEPDEAGSVEHEVMTESRHPTNSNP